jgi:hypothetical protein
MQALAMAMVESALGCETQPGRLPETSGLLVPGEALSLIGRRVDQRSRRHLDRCPTRVRRVVRRASG